MSIAIEESWKPYLEAEFEKEYMKNLKAFLRQEKEQGNTAYPPGPLIFNAFNHTPFDKVKVVILGQDPYHGKGQAHGLSFSVQKGITPPPSLKNIFKELKTDVQGFQIPDHGDLTKWAEEGILLLNAVLTVRAGEANSHKNRGWETFTDKVIEVLSQQKEGLVFLLWGKYAQVKASIINTSKHFALNAAHPSPYSADSGFFGCRHFSKTNALLQQQGKKEIDWQL